MSKKLSIMILGLFILLTSCKIQNQAYTVGTVIDEYVHSKTPYSLFSYSVNGEEHLVHGYAEYHLAKGEKYKIVYDSLNPEKAEVIWEEKIFLPGESTEKAIGTILKVGPHGCEYEYLPKNSHKPFKKVQGYYKGTLEKYPALKKGAKFEVEYSTNNIHRAIIFFDRPHQ
jgi:hypothetical protein